MNGDSGSAMPVNRRLTAFPRNAPARNYDPKTFLLMQGVGPLYCQIECGLQMLVPSEQMPRWPILRRFRGGRGHVCNRGLDRQSW